jgi:capsular polysaccharide transport system permease protein
MVNELSERARKDVIARAEAEMNDAEAQYRQALFRLNAYQNSSGIFDPGAQASETGTLLTQLMAKKLQIDSRLYVLRKSDVEQSPAVEQLKRAEESLSKQIGELRGKLAASETANDNLSKALTRFSQLDTERTLARGLYEAASRNLARARAEALRKSIYVTVFDPPAVPQESLYPRTFATPFLILLGLSVAWAIGTLGWASIEDHRL